MRLRSIFGIFLCLVTITIGSMPTASAAALVCPMPIAHKGNAYSGAPSENSINAFTTAFNVGSQWIETDVHFTSDSVPVIMHNATVDATTDGTGAIASMTAAKFTSLRLADGQHPPTLDQVMTILSASPNRHLLLEIKSTSVTATQEQILLQKLAGHEDQVHLMAFANRFPTVQRLKAANPAFVISILGYDPILPPPAGIVSEDLEYTYITAARVSQLHSLGLKVKAWTADNATAWASMRQMGVDVVITNKVRDYINWAKVTCPADPTPTAPTVSMQAPASGSELRGVQTIGASASDAVSVSSVQFQLDGVNLGMADTTTPYTLDWDTTTATDGAHSLRAIATNNSGLQTTSSPVSITVNNAPIPPTAPTVSIRTPIANSRLSGTQPIIADASDAASVSSVQFQLDGVDFGTPIAEAPYILDWDTTLVNDGTYTLRATATNEFGLQTTSSDVVVTVNNTVVTPPTAPTVAMNSPIDGSVLTGTQTIGADASDEVSVSSVQFQLDGVNLGTADTTAPYSTNWDTTTASNGTHVLRAIATNNSGLQTVSEEVNATVSNIAPPTTKEFVTNTSFETDLNGWTGLWSTNSRSTRVTGGYAGGYAHRSVNTAVAPTQHGFTSKPEVLDGTTNATVAGKVYTGTVWVKPDVIGQKINLYVRERNAAGTTVGSKTITVTTKNLNWQQLTNVYAATGTGNRISVTVWAASSAQNQGFLADMVSFTALN